MDFDKWLNDFCIDNFHFSYDALVGLSSVEGRVVRTLVNAIRENHVEKMSMGCKIDHSVCGVCGKSVELCDHIYNDSLQKKKELVEKLIMEATSEKMAELGREMTEDVKRRLDPLFMPVGHIDSLFNQKWWDARVAQQKERNKIGDELTKKMMRDLAPEGDGINADEKEDN